MEECKHTGLCCLTVHTVADTANFSDDIPFSATLVGYDDLHILIQVLVVTATGVLSVLFSYVLQDFPARYSTGFLLPVVPGGHRTTQR